jgi:hypothetical protein
MILWTIINTTHSSDLRKSIPSHGHCPCSLPCLILRSVMANKIEVIVSINITEVIDDVCQPSQQTYVNGRRGAPPPHTCPFLSNQTQLASGSQPPPAVGMASLSQARDIFQWRLPTANEAHSLPILANAVSNLPMHEDGNGCYVRRRLKWSQSTLQPQIDQIYDLGLRCRSWQVKLLMLWL